MLAGVQLYRHLARELEADCQAHGLSIDPEPRGGDRGLFSLPLGELAEEYVRLLCRAQQEGAFYLAGFSFGGILAYEVARRLRGRGREVAHLWLLDAVLPTPPGSWWPSLKRIARLPVRRQARVITREIGYGLRLLLRDPRPPEGCAAESALLGHEQRTNAYFKAAKAYLQEIGPYEGATTLVIAQRRLHEDPLLDPLCGWGPHIPRLKVRRVDAPHLDLLSAPHVREVAASFPARG